MELNWKTVWRCALSVLGVLGSGGSVWGRNVDLSTVPPRSSVELTIYNSEDLTLVRETRTVTFKNGANPLQFSWANTLIDPTSVQLRFLSRADKLELLDTTYPHDKPQMLYWNVQSEMDGPATIEISYFTSGISWSADYSVIASADETNAAVISFVRVLNDSGEEYEDAQVRLVVGSINLVEKVAQLAQVKLKDVSRLGIKERKAEEQKALREMAKNVPTPGGGNLFGGGGGGGGAAPKEIVKEGLSEYFIYTIEGTETIKNGWSKQLRSFEAQEVPFKIQYRFRPEEYGEELVRLYILTNDKPGKLGTTPLPNGSVRVFRDNGRNGLSFLAEEEIKYIPIGDKIELKLGSDPSVVFELIKLRAWRDEIWMQINDANVFRRVGQPGVRIAVNSEVVGWNEHEVFTQRIRNYTAKAIEVEVRRALPGHVIFRSALNPALHDFQTVQFTAKVPPAAKSDLLFETIRMHGRNEKQSNVTLEGAAVK